MAITDKETGVWGLDQVYNKINQGSIWSYSTSEVEQFGYTSLFSWGSASNGKLGQGSNTVLSSPTQIPGTTWSNANNDTFAANVNSYAAVKTDGTLWVWGENKYGVFGIPSEAHNQVRNSPVQCPGTTWKFVSSSDESVQAIKTDGTLWCWGRNEAGQLGQNNRTNRSSPVQVGSGTDWACISTGQQAHAAVKTDGTLWTWGDNHYGLLGLNQGHPVKVSSPTQIPGTSWVSINGGTHTMGGIKTDGTMWMWGRNRFGDLGQSQPESSHISSPVQIPGTTWSVNYEVGYENIAAIKTDGTLWLWGYNQSGQLGQNEAGGNSEATSRSSPTQVPGTTWSTVGQGTRVTLATKTDGTLWSWGQNDNGVLGQNQTGPVKISSPVQVGSDTHWAGAKFLASDQVFAFVNT